MKKVRALAVLINVSFVILILPSSVAFRWVVVLDDPVPHPQKTNKDPPKKKKKKERKKDRHSFTGHVWGKKERKSQVHTQ